MGNGIAGRQNEEKSIAMLAAQRQIYNDAKKYDWILITLSVWLPFSLSIILIFTESESLTLFSYILSLVSMVCSMLLSSYIKKKKELAGFIQQKFDTYTYKMTWDNRVFGVDKNVNHEIAIYSEKILGNDSEKARLYNWYTPIVDEKSLVTGILACQRENFSWDVGLRKRFRFASILTIVILCLTIVTIGIYLNETIYKLIWRFAFVVPMLQWILTTVKQINDDIKKLNELDGYINSTEIKSMQDLQYIQKLIYEHRKQCFGIPNFFYLAFKDSDEDREHKIASWS